MKIKINSAIYAFLIFVGFIFFFLNLKLVNTLLLISTILLLGVSLFDYKYKTSYFKLFFPFSSGIFCLLMRQFYTDPIDWNLRVNNLLLISLIFSLILLLIKSPIVGNFLESFNGLNLKKRLMSIFILVEILFILSAFIMTKKGIKLSGDEPHYLVISQSIVQDLDLNVFDQYARNKYREFMDFRLRSHAKVGKGFKKWYSFHLPGTSFTLSPLFFFKLKPPLLYFLVRCYMGLFGACLALLIYLFSIKLVNNLKWSFFITLVFTLTSPIFFMSIHVYPEIQVLTLLLSALYILLYAQNQSNLKILLAGFLLAITIFWGLKYAIFIYSFTLGFLIFFIKKKEYKKALLFIIFPILFQLLFFYYLYYAYGNFSPNSIYQGVTSEIQKNNYYDTLLNKIPLKKRLETLLDYFFDQRDGLIPYNPFYIFFFPGLLMAIKKYKTYGKYLLISLPSFLYLLYHGFTTIRAGYCPQARYLTPILWTLLLFSLVFYIETRNKPLKKIFLFLPIYSIFMVIYQTLNPFTLYQPTTHNILNRAGLVFENWSNININVSTLLPSFIKVNGNEKYLPNLVFLFLLTLFILFSFKKINRGNIVFLSYIIFFLCFLVFSFFPQTPL